MTKPADLGEFLVYQRQDHRCPIRRALNKLNPADAAALETALAADTIQHASISKWLSTRDIKVDGMAVSRHRRRICSCAQ